LSRLLLFESYAATNPKKIAGFFFGVELEWRRKAAENAINTLENGGN
jgi:hypothetical protein